MASLPEARAALAGADRVAVLTGAGISAASGLATFRGAGGLWRGLRPEEIASRSAFVRDPVLVWEWYDGRRRAALAAAPNEAHRALARLDANRAVTVATQNVDGLHGRAGSGRVLELHGSLARGRCERCLRVEDLAPEIVLPPRCPTCGAVMRPDVVWFGEPLPPGPLEDSVEAFETADVAIVVGTSALVEPAASLGRLAAIAGAPARRGESRAHPADGLRSPVVACRRRRGTRPARESAAVGALDAG